MTNTTATAAYDPHAEFIDTVAEFMLPADEAPAAWIRNRYDAFALVDDGYALATLRDEADVTLLITTESGVIRSEARFDANPIGLQMLAAALAAVA
jgi:hypothetical protein